MTLKRVNTGLALLLVLAGLYFGLSFLIDGEGAASGFGITPWPTDEGSGYYIVKGVRDIAYALTALVLLLLGHRRALGWVALTDAIMPIGDCIAVATHGGTVGFALAVHGSAAALVLLIGVLLLVEQRRTQVSSTATGTALPSV
ncbi:DUF4267 domain-containing protein [Actinosynnema sp. NPDC047251]|uniref:Putative secreted protein n=1 Tax=Saccharothrix espanaensis (strain ATCC 51144 / DSM 44229 / JCM 9112 / NBRC 15066 / NRRL 15764) TaxID=1179773 RepID=K0K417_SACES|nr:DUF4267 domain-containing protein [Saccharothrix espanaensis]CCH33051.1 putative secreted protein [Saccharothrix espanaensis DSM 44229]